MRDSLCCLTAHSSPLRQSDPHLSSSQSGSQASSLYSCRANKTHQRKSIVLRWWWRDSSSAQPVASILFFLMVKEGKEGKGGEGEYPPVSFQSQYHTEIRNLQAPLLHIKTPFLFIHFRKTTSCPSVGGSWAQTTTYLLLIIGGGGVVVVKVVVVVVVVVLLLLLLLLLLVY